MQGQEQYIVKFIMNEITFQIETLLLKPADNLTNLKQTKTL